MKSPWLLGIIPDGANPRNRELPSPSGTRGRTPHGVDGARRAGTAERRLRRGWHTATGEFPATNRSAEKAAESRCRSEEHTSELQSLMRISYAVISSNTKNSPH